MKLEFQLNGVPVAVDAPPMKRLLDVLRDDCDRTGTKDGCGEGECGACSVLVDGDLVASCLVPVIQVEGAEVRTVEGLATGHELSPLQQAFLERGAAPCGDCTAGLQMASRFFLDGLQRLPDETAAEALAGNLCRCGGTAAVIEAVELARAREGGRTRAKGTRKPAAGKSARKAPPRRSGTRPKKPARTTKTGSKTRLKPGSKATTDSRRRTTSKTTPRKRRTLRPRSRR